MPTSPPSEAIETNYPLVVGLLTKMGIEVAARLAPDKARATLVKRLTKKGVPADLTDEEKALVEGLGFGPPVIIPHPETESNDPPAPEGQPDQEPDPAIAVPFRLGDRVDNITPAIAAKRNARRAKMVPDNGQRWEIDLTSAVTDPRDQQEPEITRRAANPAQTKEPTVASSKKKTGGKGKTKTADKKETKTLTTKTPKAIKSPKAAKTEKAVKKAKAKAEGNGSPKLGRGAAARFRELLEGGERVAKAEVLAEVVKAGAKPSSAGSYIVWAKRSTEKTNPGKGGNPFGFRIKEEKEEDGTKFLQRLGKKAK